MEKTVTLDLKEYENLKKGIPKINEANLEIIKEKNEEIEKLNIIIKNDYVIFGRLFSNVKYYKKSEGIFEIEIELKEKYEKQIIELKSKAKRSDTYTKIFIFITWILVIGIYVDVYFL